MKIVVAIDSFKGSASSVEVNRSVEKAIKLVLPDA
ncbi:glycerate kinase, partial [Streptococcus pyogenes]